MRDKGYREIGIRLFGGNIVLLESVYYHRSGKEKVQKPKRGFYPGLILLGIHDYCTPAVASEISLLSTALSSTKEAQQLLMELRGYKIGEKAIVRIFKRFAERARGCRDMDMMPSICNSGEKMSVAISTDGGRTRIRKNKSGRKTKKGRNRYSTDWREPKLIIIYWLNSDGKKSTEHCPIIDANLEGPDEIFALLIYYLKKIGMENIKKLLFISDGAKWIWERVKNMLPQIGLENIEFFAALDFYHAVEHLSSIASLKNWKAQEKKKWVRKQRKLLLKGCCDKVIEEIKKVCKGAKNTLLKRERNFFIKHWEDGHLCYGILKSLNLPIGSGAVESAIRRVINMRLKGAGIFWHKETANAMLLLRSYYKAGRWNMLKNMAFIGGEENIKCCP